MDRDRFDRMTRSFATGQSRRGLLKGVAATAIGGLLATAGLADASAKESKGKGPCKSPSARCGRGKDAVCCESGVCNPDGTCGTRSNRIVTLTWGPTFSSIHCVPTVTVSGFDPGTYNGIDPFGHDFTITVEADGTGIWTTDSLYTINPGTYSASVDGVSSAATEMICP